MNKSLSVGMNLLDSRIHQDHTVLLRTRMNTNLYIELSHGIELSLWVILRSHLYYQVKESVESIVNYGAK